ncbi:MAG TPA: hypothetical protein VNJ09_09425 [Chthonomonadales bacterium]|nr:hypothetical protein [Chthonomonadales bacterium]
MCQRVLRVVSILLLAIPLSGCVDFSPDGRQLVLAWFTGEGRRGLAMVNADSARLKPVPGGEGGNLPGWSPDGKYILFATAPSTMSLYDVEKHRTHILGANLQPPFAWREDSKRFATIRTREDGEQEVVWYNLPEGGITFTTLLPCKDVAKMVWLPNTDDLALLGTDAGGQNVYMLESAESKKITTTNDVIGLSLSADRQKLIWARKSKNPRYILLSIYAYDLKSRSVLRMPFPHRVPALNPNPRTNLKSVDYVTFSPDGRRLVLLATFSAPSVRGKPNDSEYTACYSVSMTGTNARLLRRSQPTPESLFALPVWSPDGQQLALLWREDKTTTLSLFQADGAGERRLLTFTEK